MTPAAWPRERPLEERLLHVDPRARRFVNRRIVDLPDLLCAGDLLLVNDAATLPASLQGTTAAGDAVEVRLAAQNEHGWSAVVFGPGDWRTRTEDRLPPPLLARGEALQFASDLRATVHSVDPETPRLVELAFDRTGEALWSALYRHGRPVQYSHLRAPLPLWHVQTAYASRPWALEMPSAGRPLNWELLTSLRARGVCLASVTHEAGLSSTGDAALDAKLPLAERFEIPPPTAAAVGETRAQGGRIIAVGTTVVRAVEGAAVTGALTAGRGRTNLHIGPGFELRVVDGLLTGIHEPGSSHFALMSAFAPASLLTDAHDHAEKAGYLAHEFGDSCLLLPSHESHGPI